MSVFRARPTVYRGIQMRSRLEATWAAHFDGTGVEWEYEPGAFANEHGQYLPDFHVHSDTYIEVKGVLPDEGIEYWQERMEIIWDSEPDASLVLVIGRPETHVAWIGLPGHSWGLAEMEQPSPEPPPETPETIAAYEAHPVTFRLSIGAIRRLREAQAKKYGA